MFVVFVCIFVCVCMCICVYYGKGGDGNEGDDYKEIHYFIISKGNTVYHYCYRYDHYQ